MTDTDLRPATVAVDLVDRPRAADGAGDEDVERLLRASTRIIGTVAPDIEPGVNVASWLHVSRFVEASGDDSPLYTDVQYGAGTKHHTMLAPPAFVLAVRSPCSTGVLDLMEHRLSATLSSLSLTWDDTIRLSDRLDGRVHVGDVGHRYTATGEMRACVVSHVEYHRDGVRFARGRAEVEIARPGGDPPRPIHRYRPDEIAQMERELDTQQPPRGKVPRLWSDVPVGQSAPLMLKGPLTLADLMVWVFAEGRPVRAGNLQHAETAGRKGRRATHPITGWPGWDRAETSLDSAVTAPAGPAADGGLLFTLASQYVTHWMGDDAFLRQLSMRIVQPFRYGDALRLRGTVVDRLTCTDEEKTRYHAVIMLVEGLNQLSEPVLEAHAVVLLPDRGKPVRLPVRGNLTCDEALEH